MKKILLILGTVLLSFSSYAVEQYISIGGGFENYPSKTLHKIDYSFSYKSEPKEMTWVFNTSRNNTIPKFDVEYSLNFAKYFLVGVGYNYRPFDEIKDESSSSKYYLKNNFYILTALRIYQDEEINLNVGVESKIKELANYNLISSVDIKINKKYLMYAKISFSLEDFVEAKGISNNTNALLDYLSYNGYNPENISDLKVTSNTATMRLKDSVGVSFGIRYKL
ncbi:MAG: hypothetical protein LBH40_00715 [Alphaproteobacteria bacterium]|jgi:hypothetical protein|nr:hypothetical protein [Alphaproteobacteria bacterium]